MFCEVGLQTFPVRRYFIINPLSFSHFSKQKPFTTNLEKKMGVSEIKHCLTSLLITDIIIEMRLTSSQQEALNINKHVCVTAGAGSGKTTVLVQRYLKILREGKVKSPQEIVAITFTEKAAAEMKERIIKELSAQEARSGIEQGDSLQHFREEMGSAHISTIHAFCSRILREFPFQARVPANFTIIQGIDQKLLLQQTIKDTLKEIATNTSDRHRAELARLLQRYGGQQKLVDFFSTMLNQRDVVAQIMREIYSNPDNTEIREGWEHQVREELTSAIDITDFIRCLKAALHVAKGKNA
jgi:ATP-dependent exoDNAse (exonuclease V) beta subunit